MRGSAPFRAALALVGVITVALAALEVVLLLSWHAAVPGVLVLFPIVGLIYLAAGVSAWSRRPSNRLGALLILGALAWLAAGLLNVTVPAIAAIGLVTAVLPLALVLHMLVAFPSGRLRGRADRAAVAAIYFATLVLQAPAYLFGQGADPVSAGLAIADRPELARLGSTVQDSVGALAAAIAIVLLAARYRAASPAQRRVLGPLYLYGIAVWLFIPLSARTIPPLLGPIELAVFQLALVAGIPIAFAIAVRRGGFAQMADLDELSAWLAVRSDGAVGLTRALSCALGDPTLRLVLWAPRSGGYVDSRGDRAVDPGPGEAAVEVMLAGRRIGAIVYDAALIGEPSVVHAAARTVAVALDHQRLTVELTASGDRLRRSRERIAHAADDERRRIARDLHDGMQSRLVLLGMEASMLSSAPDLSPDARTAVAELRNGLEASVRELGALVHGLMPPALLERGLSAAVEDLADRTPIRTDVDLDLAPGTPVLSPAVELTAYFVIAEALANTVRHADASRLQVALHQRDGRLRVDVRDDGDGGAIARGETGIRGIADRVDVLGGDLTIDSPPGGGTRITAEIPCAS